MRQAYEFKRKENWSFTLEGAKGEKGKYLFAFSQGRELVKHILSKKKNLRLAILTQKGELIITLESGCGLMALVSWFLLLTKAKRDEKGRDGKVGAIHSSSGKGR